MSKQKLLKAGCLLMGGLALGLSVSQFSTAQPAPASPPAEVDGTGHTASETSPVFPVIASGLPVEMQGRYQMEVVYNQPGDYSRIFVFDTHTGKVWSHRDGSGAGKWNDLGSPAPDAGR